MQEKFKKTDILFTESNNQFQNYEPSKIMSVTVVKCSLSMFLWLMTITPCIYDLEGVFNKVWWETAR